ncbi:hypothetical protein TNCT_40511 [Trichonephila clavata]|uniref:Uncharacterized protein n=1 Tax=Trichonephila clavata TaxID=2740835 RepID=A0A8X6LQ13_TRICU|nr:hypothetical protein TNCT_40511 [Trichonephila clavata]
MESSESDSDDEMHLEQEERSPTTQPPPPSIDHFRSQLHSAIYAIVCMNICIDMKDILKTLNFTISTMSTARLHITTKCTR